MNCALRDKEHLDMGRWTRGILDKGNIMNKDRKSGPLAKKPLEDFGSYRICRR